ncbi:alpha/beta-hydrolase [Nemania abortiva]|nr:alpha/beta-hydrolase [Nemania abortiva]
MPSTGLPTILLVPGAFGKPAGFDPLLPYLEEAGFTTHPGPYPSCDPVDPTVATCEADIASLRMAGGAAEDLDKETRKEQGHVTGVTGLIYVAGNITLEGESLLQAPSEGLAVIEPAMSVLYNDCDPALEPELAKQMKPHALQAFATAASAPAWKDGGFNGKRAYIRTLKDCCNPSWLQDSWIEKSEVQWEVIDFDTGYMPFISQPKELAETIMRLSYGFADNLR